MVHSQLPERFGPPPRDLVLDSVRERVAFVPGPWSSRERKQGTSSYTDDRNSTCTTSLFETGYEPVVDDVLRDLVGERRDPGPISPIPSLESISGGPDDSGDLLTGVTTGIRTCSPQVGTHNTNPTEADTGRHTRF